MSSPGGGAASGSGKLTLTYNGTPVDFDYLPSKIKYSRSQITTGTGTFQETQESAVTNVKAVTFNVDNLRLEGAAALSKIGTLFSWLVMLPGPPSPGGGSDSSTAAKGDNQRGTPKILTLTMGSGNAFSTGKGITGQVILTNVTVNYVRFNQGGDPVRADVNLQMELHEKNPGRTNPTSYSPAGGKVHVTTAGDNLQRIAHSTYADPAAWRNIAEANDIDDPLRVRNGRSLFLPYSRTRRG